MAGLGPRHKILMLVRFDGVGLGLKGLFFMGSRVQFFWGVVRVVRFRL